MNLQEFDDYDAKYPVESTMTTAHDAISQSIHTLQMVSVLISPTVGWPEVLFASIDFDGAVSLRYNQLTGQQIQQIIDAVKSTFRVFVRSNDARTGCLIELIHD